MAGSDPRNADGSSAGAYSGPDGLRKFHHELSEWFEGHGPAFAPKKMGDTLAGEAARTTRNQALLWQAGWLRYGWPVSVGGFGGSPLLRAAVAEQAAVRELFYDTLFAVVEVLLPSTAAAAPELAATYGPAFLQGSQRWCQGFSEPDAGSDLASLRCRAVDKGDYWLVTGQKIWTSYAQFATRMFLLARTGSTESRHRGITAMLIDMDWPGVTVRPLRGINGEEEFSETFLDEVRVPKDRLIGSIDGGWSLAMDILRSERGAIFWTLSARVLEELRHLIDDAQLSPAQDQRLGHLFATIGGLRCRSWTTQHRMERGAIATPETSVDKILMATAEQELFDFALNALDGIIELGDTETAQQWRSAYMYSRAASIYGGTAEIQRNILSEQVLGLRGLP